MKAEEGGGTGGISGVLGPDHPNTKWGPKTPERVQKQPKNRQKSVKKRSKKGQKKPKKGQVIKKKPKNDRKKPKNHQKSPKNGQTQVGHGKKRRNIAELRGLLKELLQVRCLYTSHLDTPYSVIPFQEHTVKKRKKAQPESMSGRCTESWRKTHATMRAQHNMPFSAAPWTRSGHKVQGVDSERGADAIEIAFFLMQQQGAECCRIQDTLMDVSQTVSRRAWGPTARSLTTSSALFSFGAEMMIPPLAHFQILGFPPIKDGEALSEHTCRTLSGEAMAPPAVALCMLACAFALPDLWAA